MALCSGLAPLINNHFGRRALLRGRLRLHAINATALIEETVTTAAPNRGRGRFHGSFAGRLNTPARTNSRQPGAMNFARDGARQVGPPRHTPERTLSRNASAPDRMSRCVPAEGRDAVSLGVVADCRGPSNGSRSLKRRRTNPGFAMHNGTMCKENSAPCLICRWSEPSRSAYTVRFPASTARGPPFGKPDGLLNDDRE